MCAHCRLVSRSITESECKLGGSLRVIESQTSNGQSGIENSYCIRDVELRFRTTVECFLSSSGDAQFYWFISKQCHSVAFILYHGHLPKSIDAFILCACIIGINVKILI